MRWFECIALICFDCLRFFVLTEVCVFPAVTHEVADCVPTLKKAPASCRWEPCTVLKQNDDDTYDLRIRSDIAVCKGVPKRFVRPVKLSKSKLWCPAKVQELRQVMQKVRSDIQDGTVMPSTYMKHAASLFQAKYPGMSRKAIASKWNYEVVNGRETAILSPETWPLPTEEHATTVPTRTTGRSWSEVEERIFADVMTGLCRASIAGLWIIYYLTYIWCVYVK